MTWKRDLRPDNVRDIGGFKIFSEVNPDRETAHVVVFPDGRELRVLPDGRSGAARSNLVRRATEGCHALSERLGSPDALLVVFRGYADVYALKWQEVTPGVPIEEWLAHWLTAEGHPVDGEIAAGRLIWGLKADGWQIVRAG